MISTGARALIDVLLEQGVDTVFGYPGSAVLDIYDELYKCDKIRHILTCHEQASNDGSSSCSDCTIFFVWNCRLFLDADTKIH